MIHFCPQCSFTLIFLCGEEEGESDLITKAPNGSLLYRLFHEKLKRPEEVNVLTKPYGVNMLSNIVKNGVDRYFFFMNEVTKIVTNTLASQYAKPGQMIFDQQKSYFESLNAVYLNRRSAAHKKKFIHQRYVL